MIHENKLNEICMWARKKNIIDDDSDKKEKEKKTWNGIFESFCLNNEKKIFGHLISILFSVELMVVEMMMCRNIFIAVEILFILSTATKCDLMMMVMVLKYKNKNRKKTDIVWWWMVFIRSDRCCCCAIYT